MSDNYIKQLDEYCTKNGNISSNYETVEQKPFGYLTTITVGMGEGIAPIVVSDFGDNEEQSRSNAAKTLLNDINDKSYEQMIEKTQQLAINTNKNKINGSNSTKPAIAETKVQNIPNSVGYLQELYAKDTKSSVKYVELNKSGEDHNPVFTIKCILTSNGKEISGEGKARNKQEAKKLSALEVIKQLESSNASGKQSLDNNNDSNQVLNNYFRTNFGESQQLNRYLDEKGVDYCQKLDKIAPILGCRLDYEQSVSDCTQVVLKLIVDEINYPLITTYAATDETLDVSKRIAAKKAVNILKILNTN